MHHNSVFQTSAMTKSKPVTRSMVRTPPRSTTRLTPPPGPRRITRVRAKQKFVQKWPRKWKLRKTSQPTRNGAQYVSNERGLRIWLKEKIPQSQWEKIEDNLQTDYPLAQSTSAQCILFQEKSDIIPSDWVMNWSKRKDRPFVSNLKTGETRWLRM